MKKLNLGGIVEELQRENLRLKSQLVSLRKQLNTYENKMMDELTKLDPTKVVYQTSMQCLDAFLKQLSSITSDYHQKNTSIHDLQIKVKKIEYKYEVSQQCSQKFEKKLSEMQLSSQELQRKKKESEARLIEEIKQLKAKNNTLNATYNELQKRMQLKQISIEQQKRVAISAIIHQSKKQMLQFREHLQNQFLNQTIKLQNQIRSKDDKIKNLIKGLLKYDKGQKVTSEEIGQMKELIEYIGNIEELNTIINQLKDDNFTLKKEIKQALNRKTAAELKIFELRNQISNLLLKNQKKDTEISSLQEYIVKIRGELANEKEETKNLEHYFQQKWHNEFQKVQNHLEKSYNQKIGEHEKDLETKKAEVSRKIESYIFLHKQDQKIIQDLKKRIENLQDDIKNLSNTIKNERGLLQEIKIQIDETNQMINEDISSYQYQWSLLIEEKDAFIGELQQQLDKTCVSRETYKIKAAELTNSLKAKFQQEKILIQRKFVKQKEDQLKLISIQFEQQRKKNKQILTRLKKQQDFLKTQHQFQITQVKLRLNRELDRITHELEQQRKIQKQYINQSELREKSLKKEIQDLKQYFMKKITDLEKEIQAKKATLKVINVKSENDEDLKKELRQMIEQKINECKELLKEKQDLENELQARDSQINHLNHENAGLRLSKDDWLKIILEVKDDFLTDLSSIKENHWKQLQIFKSKIWELQNIISKRPIRIQDEKRIRNLSQQKKQLQNKVEIKQAENIVLKQIKHYYEKRNEVKTCASQMSLTETQLKKPQTVLIMNKRPRRTKISFYQNLKRQSQEQGETNGDIKKMRKYLQKFREANNSHNEGVSTKNGNRMKQTSRNFVNKSLEA